MKKTKIYLALAIGVLAASALIATILLTAGWHTDVVSARSAASFAEVLQAAKELTGGDASSAWTLSSPDGRARLAWRGETESDPSAVASLSFDAAPFIQAGLDVEKLPAAYTLTDGWLAYAASVAGSGTAVVDTPLRAYERLIALNPSMLGYHAPMDHFGLKLGGGNMFEWAQNLSVNVTTGGIQDKDAVFVLEPEPFIEAGVDPAAVSGWSYAQVPVMENGVSVLVFKFLKPFNLI